jgi:hypothetical protein
MSKSLLIELNPSAVAHLELLMRQFGEDKPEVMIARALGLLDLVQEYLGPDGTLTVVNGRSVERNGEEELVDLVFENRAKMQAGQAAGLPS